MIAYIDSSSFLRNVLKQDRFDAVQELTDYIHGRGGRLVSSELLKLETRRTQVRLQQEWIDFKTELDEIDLIVIANEDMRLAFDIDAHVECLDALHLASCLKIGADALITSDKNMREAAEHLGILVHWAG